MQIEGNKEKRKRRERRWFFFFLLLCSSLRQVLAFVRGERRRRKEREAGKNRGEMGKDRKYIYVTKLVREVTFEAVQ